MRRTIFLYDDGIVLCCTLRALEDLRILEPSLSLEGSLGAFHPEIDPAGFGYLRAGLRSLVGQGWLAQAPGLDPSDVALSWTAEGRAAMAHRAHYVAVGDYLARFRGASPESWCAPWRGGEAEAFRKLLGDCLDGWGLEPEMPEKQRESIEAHLNAGLVVPALLKLRATERLGGPAPLAADDEMGAEILALLGSLGWLDGEGRWTEVGRLARDYAIHFGIVGSYLPLLARLPDLYRGELTVAPSPEQESGEWHVNRELNVVASAAAHRRYFDDADRIFIELFDREPIAEQPRFIADMGCGDGSWLIHLHRLIRERTLRGAQLDRHPLLMVGVDCSRTALDTASRTLDQAGVPGLLLPGDVGDPEGLRDRLAEHGLAIEDGLHVRSFLDHDRTYLGEGADISVPGTSSGAYVDPDGHPLAAEEVERDLAAHLRRWAPLVSKHGLVVLEAHCVSPQVASRHRGALHSVAFDSYHAYSHQFPVEYSSFVRCCRQAGLERVSRHERHYPSSRPFVAVSLNRLLARDGDPALPGLDDEVPADRGWRPGPELDLADGRALHELLFANGQLGHPRLWCAPATGYVVAGALEAIKRRLEVAAPGEAIRVLDYGAGTGLASIELLKACQELGLEGRFQQRGITLELHLADLPSSWFAQGYELLRQCAWTRFHSLRGAEGGFRSLPEVTGGEQMDVVMANMVFHLIPPTALPRLAAELASVIAPGGRLAWSSPDLGPPGPFAVLFHDPNRALRALWLQLLSEDPRLGSPGRNGDSARLPADVREIVELTRAALDPSSASAAQARADRRILPQAHHAAAVDAALSEHLDGSSITRCYEILDEEILDAILVPSNQAEFISEVPDSYQRERLIRHLMVEEVLPGMRAGPAGTALGLNLQWALGRLDKPI